MTQTSNRGTGLPRISALTISSRRYDAPRPFIIGGQQRSIRDVVEFELQTDGPIPARGMSAVLFVGQVIVDEFEPLAVNRYRFTAIEPGRLTEGATIALGYPRSAPTHRSASPVRYRLGPPLVT